MIVTLSCFRLSLAMAMTLSLSSTNAKAFFAAVKSSATNRNECRERKTKTPNAEPHNQSKIGGGLIARLRARRERKLVLLLSELQKTPGRLPPLIGGPPIGPPSMIL